MLLPTLYQLDAHGALRHWSIEVDGAAFRTHYGALHGVPQTSEWTQVEGTTRLTPEERALAKAQKKWQTHVEKGWSSDADALSTTAYIRPMLAREWQKRRHTVQWPVFGQPKFDGIRAIAANGALTSRRGKPITSCAHVLAALPSGTFDGELVDAASFQNTASLVRRLDATDATVERVVYQIFDAPLHPGTYAERLAWLREVVRESDAVRVVDTAVLHDDVAVDAALERALEAGHEGLMLRANTAYEQSRCDGLLKYKVWQDAEFLVTAVIEGKGGREGEAGSVECLLPNGRHFYASVGGDQAERIALLRHPPIGKFACIKFHAYSSHGVPRFPNLLRIL